MPIKDPAILGNAVLKNGHAMTTQAGTNIISVSTTGVVTVNTSTETIVDLTTTGNTVIGDASSDTLTVNATPTFKTDVTVAEAKNIVLGTTTGTKIGTGATQKIGFYNATPVVQPATTGTTAGFTVVGASAIVAPESTFTGNTGSTAYTIGDIIKNLKTLGILAA